MFHKKLIKRGSFGKLEVMGPISNSPECKKLLQLEETFDKKSESIHSDKGPLPEKIQIIMRSSPQYGPPILELRKCQ